ncbi:hypothetical protein ES703_101336 [subsurface metagenome]
MSGTTFPIAISPRESMASMRVMRSTRLTDVMPSISLTFATSSIFSMLVMSLTSSTRSMTSR